MKYVCLCAFLVLTGCTTTSADNNVAGMANPASVYCEEQEGEVEIRKDPKGESGYCHLPDGRVVEEWEFFRAKDNPA